VATLRRWGLLERLLATACPPIDTYRFDFGPFALSGSPGTGDTPVAYGPRRTVLDKLLVDAAAEAGAEVREGFTVTDVVNHDGQVTGVRSHGRDRRTVTEHARVVVGADGRHSLVARAVAPEQYREQPPHPGHRRLAVRGVRGQQARPRRQLRQDAGVGPGLRRARPRHHPRGPLRRGRRPELLPEAVRARLGAGRGRRLQQGLHHRPGHARRLPGRRQVLPMYELTTQLATLEPPPPDLQRLLAAAHGNQEAMDGFARVIAGVTSPAEFFSEQSVGRILAQAAYASDRSG
jgi:2-polyprenyl-6-methoxyphenol hydroxylase-like FAD-dependent oxidoreductase